MPPVDPRSVYYSLAALAMMAGMVGAACGAAATARLVVYRLRGVEEAVRELIVDVRRGHDEQGETRVKLEALTRVCDERHR